MQYVWPIVLIVLSNTLYQICAKSVPGTANPFASLSVTYPVGAVCALGMYFLLEKRPNLLQEYRELNWAPFVLGLVIVGLEVGFVYAYRAGWPVSTASFVQSALLAVVLLFVGFLLYREVITLNKLAGLAICFVGLFFLNQ